MQCSTRRKPAVDAPLPESLTRNRRAAGAEQLRVAHRHNQDAPGQVLLPAARAKLRMWSRTAHHRVPTRTIRLAHPATCRAMIVRHTVTVTVENHRVHLWRRHGSGDGGTAVRLPRTTLSPQTQRFGTSLYCHAWRVSCWHRSLTGTQAPVLALVRRWVCL